MGPLELILRRRRRRRRRWQARALAVALVLALVASLALSTGALADALSPESGGSPNADRIDTLYKIALAIGTVVFLGVEGALVYMLIRFRVRRGVRARRMPAQIRGNTRLEIAWAAIPQLILLILVAVTFAMLGSINDPARSGGGGLPVATANLTASTSFPTPPGGKRITIAVNGQQYIWRFTYPNKAFSYTEMVVPANTTVILAIQSQDVDHSWWIPKLGGKFDAIPGYTNYTWFKAPTAGVTYTGQCAELCGRNHADMLARVRVVTPAQYETWLARQKQLIQRAQDLVKRGPPAS